MTRAVDTLRRLAPVTLLLGVVFAGGTANADPNARLSAEVHLASPVSGRTTVTLRLGAVTRRVTVGRSPAPAELDPLFQRLDPGPERALVRAESRVPYELVVAVMAALRRHGVDEVALAPTAPQPPG